MVRCFGILCFKQKTAYEMRISDWSSDVCSSDLFLLDLGHRLDLVREPCGIHELGIDFGEIHHREIKARKLVDGEAQALLALRRAPRPAELAPSLLLKNTAEFTLEAAIGRAPGLKDAKKTRRTIGPNIVTEDHAVLDIEPHLALGASEQRQERGCQSRDRRRTNGQCRRPGAAGQ